MDWLRPGFYIRRTAAQCETVHVVYHRGGNTSGARALLISAGLPATLRTAGQLGQSRNSTPPNGEYRGVGRYLLTEARRIVDKSCETKELEASGEVDLSMAV